MDKPLIVMLTPDTQSAAYSATLPLREGILTAYEKDKDHYDIKQVPLSSGNELQNVLEKAADDGAMLVIGPLFRDNVEKVASFRYLPLPVVAVNRTSRLSPPELFLNIDIAAEGELAELLQIAVEQTNDSPNASSPFLILSTENAYDLRLARSADEIFRSLSIPVELKTVTAESAVSTALNSAHIPYRGIFFACSSSFASLMRPYLGDVPVFGTSYSNPYTNEDTMTAQTQANDLRGMVTLEIPVLSKLNSPVFSEYRAKLLSLPPAQRQMFAVGVDIWNISKEWLQWKTNFDYPNGLTGALHFDKSKNFSVVRTLEAGPLSSNVQTHAQEEPDFVE